MTPDRRKLELETRLRASRARHANAMEEAERESRLRRDVVREALDSGLFRQTEVAGILGVGKARVGQIAKSG